MLQDIKCNMQLLKRASADLILDFSIGHFANLAKTHLAHSSRDCPPAPGGNLRRLKPVTAFSLPDTVHTDVRVAFFNLFC